MSWNEGNDRQRDPWDDQGPPDLDDAFRKFKSQFGGLFGGGKGSGGGKGRFNLKGSTWTLIVLALVVIYGAFGIYQVDEQEEAVVFRFGKVMPDTKPAGLQWNFPIVDVVEIVNVTQVRTIEHNAQMLTEDENIVLVDLEVQYVVSDPKSYIVEIESPTVTVEHATESALRHVVGSYTFDRVITEGRVSLFADIQSRLQGYLNTYKTGILIDKVNVRTAGPPAEVQAAFDDVQEAEEDEVRLQNEASAYAEGIVPEARGIAQKEIEAANAYRDRTVARAEGEAQRFLKLLEEYKAAPEVTRTRLWVTAMEQFYSKSAKVVVDIEGGNNLMYLPLDQLRTLAGAAARGTGGSQSTNTLSNQ